MLEGLGAQRGDSIMPAPGAQDEGRSWRPPVGVRGEAPSKPQRTGGTRWRRAPQILMTGSMHNYDKDPNVIIFFFSSGYLQDTSADRGYQGRQEGRARKC